MSYRILVTIEMLILTVLILATRCANYADVFVAGNVYFTDADCYARMTRVRLCAEHPGRVLRHHDFENFPEGTTPHTTAPMDYLILSLAAPLKLFCAYAIDLAGAFISPLLALIGGWFLCWWLHRMGFIYRWAALILYSISPILVHGTELGRPDHQSLLIILILIGLCAYWKLQSGESKSWGIVFGAAWGLALWISLYEPLILLALIIAVDLFCRPHNAPQSQRLGWMICAIIVAFSLLIERRIPSFSILRPSDAFTNWSRTIGELVHVSPLDWIWLSWAGYILVLAPILIWFAIQNRKGPPVFLLVLLLATYFLTIWQARWSYFFILILALSLPSLLEPFQSRLAVWCALGLSILPILKAWDNQLWPNELELVRRIEQRNEAAQLRELALTIRSSDIHAFIAPWWLSPSIAYWSGQPAVAGSSHESLPGTIDTARFFLAEDATAARQILLNRHVDWVFAYDSDRMASNSAALLGLPVPKEPLCRILDRSPSHAPRYLILSGQTGTSKLFRFSNKL